jgi:hypothetical protein
MKGGVGEGTHIHVGGLFCCPNEFKYSILECEGPE